MEQDRARLTEQLRDASYLLAVQGMLGSSARELDDENPVIPLGIHIDQNVATAALLGWSEQDSGYEPSLWTASIEQREGDWVPYGLAGGVPPSDYPLADRPSCSQDGPHIRLYMGPNPEHELGRRPGPAWLSAALQVAASLATKQPSGPFAYPPAGCHLRGGRRTGPFRLIDFDLSSRGTRRENR